MCWVLSWDDILGVAGRKEGKRVYGGFFLGVWKGVLDGAFWRGVVFCLVVYDTTNHEPPAPVSSCSRMEMFFSLRFGYFCGLMTTPDRPRLLESFSSPQSCHSRSAQLPFSAVDQSFVLLLHTLVEVLHAHVQARYCLFRTSASIFAQRAVCLRHNDAPRGRTTRFRHG